MNELHDSTSPAQRCAGLAEQLTDMARDDLEPRLRSLLPGDRKAAVRAYWIEQLADLGFIGQALSHPGWNS